MQLPQSADSLRSVLVLRCSERSDSQEFRTIRLAHFRASRNPTRSKRRHFVAEPASVSVRNESNCSAREVVRVPNTPRVMFAVDDIDETLEKLRKRGAQL